MRNKIEVRNITKVYQMDKARSLVAVQGLDLEVKENEFLAVVGPTGCGKSTLLYMIAGFLEVTEGEILLDSKAVRGPGPDRGIVFQHFALFPWRTVKGNILYGLEEKGLDRPAREEATRQYIELVNLKGFEDSFPSQLSGGMKQRVALARTLAFDPQVLLMDEPFGSLDAQTRSAMQEELLQIWSRRKKTVIFVTHDVREAVYLADRVAVMTSRPGKIKEIVETQLDRAIPSADVFDYKEYVEKFTQVQRSVQEEFRKTGELA